MKKVSVGIICREFNGLKKYLLICSLKNYGEFTGYYYPSGGHVEEGEDSTHAVIREIREELGIEVKPVILIAETPGDVNDQLTYWWLCETKENPINNQPAEIADLRWFSEEEIRTEIKIWPATKKIFLEYFFDKQVPSK